MIVFIMRGTSRSGKSTFSEKLTNPNNIISSDNYREHYFGNINEQKFQDFIFHKMFETLKCRLVNKVDYTFWDATNLKMKYVNKIIDMCNEYGSDFRIVSIIPPSLETLLERNHDDKFKVIPDEVIEKHHKDYFRYNEGFKNTFKDRFVEVHWNE